MTFDATESSREGGVPASIYLFEWGNGSGSFHAYTDTDVPVTVDGVNYEPIPIGRGNIESSGTLDKKVLEIEISPKAGIVSQYADNPPTRKVGLVIRQGHVGDTDWPVVFSGVVKGVGRASANAKVSAEPLDTLLARPGLRRLYMTGCPHVLYSDQCGASKDTLRRQEIPTVIGLNHIDLPSGWDDGVGPTKYRGGYVQWTDSGDNTQTRTILSTSGSLRLLVGNTRRLDVGTTVSVHAGCNHNKQDCSDLHDNIANFGGQPYIPLENPVGMTSRYY